VTATTEVIGGLMFVREHPGKKKLFSEPVTPGRHEAAALASDCVCGHQTEPALVIDEGPLKRGGQDGRYALYSCQNCASTWLSWWPRPH
jgi:hypothetical protein